MNAIKFGWRLFMVGLVVWVLLGMGIISPVWAGSQVIITSGGSAKHAVALTFDHGPSPVLHPQFWPWPGIGPGQGHLLCVGLQGGALSRCG